LKRAIPIAFVVLLSLSVAARAVSLSPTRSQTLNTQHSTLNAFPSPHHVKAEIHSILSTKEFRSALRPSPLAALQERMVAIILDILNRIAEWWPDINLAPNRLDSALEWFVAILAYILMAAGITGVLYVLVQAGRRILGPSAGGRAAKAERSALSEAGVRTPDQALRLAAERARNGEFQGAFRAAYLAILLWMDARRLVEYAPSRTNWEYVRAAAGSSLPSVHEPLRTLTGDFDRKVYGGEACGRADYEKALSIYQSIASESDTSGDGNEDQP
jgi:hypothetical protein